MVQVRTCGMQSVYYSNLGNMRVQYKARGKKGNWRSTKAGLREEGRSIKIKDSECTGLTREKIAPKLVINTIHSRPLIKGGGGGVIRSSENDESLLCGSQEVVISRGESRKTTAHKTSLFLGIRTKRVRNKEKRNGSIQVRHGSMRKGEGRRRKQS